MAMAGVDLPTLKELMGHSSITLTMRYVHPTPEHKREAIDKLVAWNHPQNPPTVERVETRTSLGYSKSRLVLLLKLIEATLSLLRIIAGGILGG